jgi:hypothetical protein
MKDFKFTEENILSLWQNEYYKNMPLVLYQLVNEYLWTGKFYHLEEDILETLNLSQSEFESWTKKYINELNNLLYSKKQGSKILYRGESRKKFNCKEGDILIYNNFHSTCDNISFALNFAEHSGYLDVVTIILVFDIPEGMYWKKLDNTMISYNPKKKIKYYVNEFEYLIPPNCYYRITKIHNLPRNIMVIKARMILQEKFNYLDLMYKNKQIPLEHISDFSDINTDTFIKELDRYEKNIEVLKRLDKYHIDHDIYMHLYNNEKLFRLDVLDIQNLVRGMSVSNYNSILDSLDRIGFVYSKQGMKKDLNKFIVRIQYLGFFDFSSIKTINNFKVYYGETNFTTSMEEPEIIKMIKNNSTGVIDTILDCEIAPDCFLYNCAYNDMEPNVKIESNNKIDTIYTKYIIEFQLENIPICISNQVIGKRQTKVLLVPKFNYKIISSEKNTNKFNMSIHIYKILLYK